MTPSEFDQIVAERLHRTKVVLASKQSEYAREDRMHNFKRGAAIGRTTPEKACKGYMIKHICSVFDMIDDIDERQLHHSIDAWEEKIGDAINYFILLEALVKERYNALGRELVNNLHEHRQGSSKAEQGPVDAGGSGNRRRKK